MYFYEILLDIMEEKSLRISDVARMCGLTDSTVRSIITRKNKTVALEVAFKLAKGLGVSLERLNGDWKLPASMSQDKKRLIAAIEPLSEAQVHAVMAFIQYLHQE